MVRSLLIPSGVLLRWPELIPAFLSIDGAMRDNRSRQQSVCISLHIHRNHQHPVALHGNPRGKVLMVGQVTPATRPLHASPASMPVIPEWVG